jgi:hypothetical protein
MPLDDFQNYRAVIDLDGNSWSERFPKLLCRNSVVIKVEPEQVDYFWPTLQAGVHYVATNLTNLVETVQYVLSKENDAEMQRVVANARRWCRQRMVSASFCIRLLLRYSLCLTCFCSHARYCKVVQQIQWDILSILNGYAQELYKADPHWYRHISKQDFDQMKFRHPSQWKNQRLLSFASSKSSKA